MKNLIWLLFVSGILLFSCQSENFPDTFRYGLNEIFQAGDDYCSANQSLKFRIAEINDSRCPSDVICIWQGEAVVKIAVETPLSGSLELSTFNNLTDTIGPYSFELIDVAPYPISTKTIRLEEYKVTLKISEISPE
ncbi:MAG: hypothetical protein EOM73_15235 [Bacteroidia bacterium]|nr:hypothetical protein [Bacteroidia bacterium]